jgi:predicted AlkP superfamily phosphohydrolase/phosphomutase
MELSKDGKDFRLYVTGLCALDGWSHPKELADEITSEEGLPVPHGGFAAFNLEWIDSDTFMDVLDFQHIWLADAATYLLKNRDWDLYFMHAHCPDWAHHGFSNKIDPLTAENPEQAEAYQNVELGFYQSLDRMIERILKYADDETLVVMVSDHGAKATTKRAPVAQILVNAGLTVFKETPEGGRQIDWSKTKAVLQRSCYIYVNLRGRDPDGIVEREEYEEVQDQIVNALYDYTDPDTGKKPIVMALRKQDARIIGLYGDRVGDVVYAISSEYGGQHGPHLPTTKYGLGDLRGLFIMAGPGVKKGHVLERTVWLPDVVPTVCYLADLPIPKNAEGAILYQALEDSDMKMKDMERLRKNYERLKNAYEKEQALTHTYNA